MTQGTPQVRRSPLAKYVLLELPGWALAGGILGFLVWHGDLTRPWAVLIFALWVLKDFALYPLLRAAYEDGRPDGAGALLGALGSARDRLDPEGYVRVGSELWRAVVPREQAPVEAGAAVRVVEVQGLTLHVERA